MCLATLLVVETIVIWTFVPLSVVTRIKASKFYKVIIVLCIAFTVLNFIVIHFFMK